MPIYNLHNKEIRVFCPIVKLPWARIMRLGYIWETKKVASIKHSITIFNMNIFDEMFVNYYNINKVGIDQIQIKWFDSLINQTIRIIFITINQFKMHVGAITVRCAQFCDLPFIRGWSMRRVRWLSAGKTKLHLQNARRPACVIISWQQCTNHVQ